LPRPRTPHTPRFPTFKFISVVFPEKARLDAAGVIKVNLLVYVKQFLYTVINQSSLATRSVLGTY
jgi:hypothetical protein